MATFDTEKSLEKEVLQLFKLIQKMREDLSIARKAEGEGLFLDTAADQLNAIAQESERASQSILDALETISATNIKLGSEIKYAGARPHFEAISSASQTILESCQIHEIISQRISNIVRTINIVEGTLNSLVLTLGDDNIVGVSSTLARIGKQDGKLTLTGPAVGDEGMNQDEIDGLFGPSEND